MGSACHSARTEAADIGCRYPRSAAFLPSRIEHLLVLQKSSLLPPPRFLTHSSVITLPVLPFYLMYIGYIWFDRKKAGAGLRKSKWLRTWWVFRRFVPTRLLRLSKMFSLSICVLYHRFSLSFAPVLSSSIVDLADASCEIDSGTIFRRNLYAALAWILSAPIYSLLTPTASSP